MKSSTLKHISKNFSHIMEEVAVECTPKELSEKAKISYSTLAPILRGDRDFGITKLLALAEALNVTPNDILEGAFRKPPVNYVQAKPKIKYLVSFVTNAMLTRCKIVDLNSKEEQTKLVSFSLFCAKDVYKTIEEIAITIEDMAKTISNIGGTAIDFREFAIYATVLGYEHIKGREHLQAEGERYFGFFLIEPDWKALHHSIFRNSNGILVTINDGYVVSYSTDHNKTIHKSQGYYFPISDEAGNMWLGCEAIKHAINVYEKVEERTLLSDKILSLVDSNLDIWSTKAFDKPHETFTEASAVLKELAYNKEKKSRSLIKKGFENIWKKIIAIDNVVGDSLPISLAGNLAYLYEEFIPKQRLVKTDFVNESESFNYTTAVLMKMLSEKSAIKDS